MSKLEKRDIHSQIVRIFDKDILHTASPSSLRISLNRCSHKNYRKEAVVNILQLLNSIHLENRYAQWHQKV